MSNITLTIDNQKVEVKSDATLLEAIQSIGINVPTLCHHPSLKPDGSCRICVVEDMDNGRLLASCSTPVSQGLKIKTHSDEVVEARKLNLELLLANHPNDCMICESDGNCKLQDLVYTYDIKEPTFGTLMERTKKKENRNPFIEFDQDKCILCGRCVRTCKELQVSNAIEFTERGSQAQILNLYGKDMKDISTCVHCGQCVEMCPTGALTYIPSKNKGRSYSVDRKVETVCSYCGVGCKLELKVKNNEVIGVGSVYRDGTPNPDGETCVKGRFAYEFINHPDRLRKPLIKKNNKFEEVSWDEAFDFVADRIKTLVSKNGPNTIGGLTSARCTNEENYLFQKFMRAGVGTNNVDHCARL